MQNVRGRSVYISSKARSATSIDKYLLAALSMCTLLLATKDARPHHKPNIVRNTISEIFCPLTDADGTKYISYFDGSVSLEMSFRPKDNFITGEYRNPHDANMPFIGYAEPVSGIVAADGGKIIGDVRTAGLIGRPHVEGLVQTMIEICAENNANHYMSYAQIVMPRFTLISPTP